MPEMLSLILSGTAGFLSGFLVSIPAGPTNVTIINETTKRGLRYGIFIGVGSVVMEVIHSSITTGIPFRAMRSRNRAFQLDNLKQPCDSVRPTFSGAGVP